MENDLKKPSPIPKLVTDDEWLKPQTEQIQQRIQRYSKELKEVCALNQPLSDYATTHQSNGVHFQASSNQWTIQEWAPQAKSIQLA